LSKRLHPIGVLHTELKTPAQCPRQGSITENKGEAEIFPEYAEGLKGLDKCAYVWLLYQFDSPEKVSLTVTPPHLNEQRGLFATRSPHRVNPIGLTLVKVTEVKENRVKFVGADMLDGTGLLDIKPYSAEIDTPAAPEKEP